jgi:hypothetical protein
VGDSLADLAALRGRPFADPEFVTLQGGWFEAVFILSDDGWGGSAQTINTDHSVGAGHFQLALPQQRVTGETNGNAVGH